jgi:hypothetical protein
MPETNEQTARQKAIASLTRSVKIAPRSAEQLAADRKMTDDWAVENGNVGHVMYDGTVYAGISPETNKPMFAMPEDASVTMAFKAAIKYAKKLDALGHQDWRLPAETELEAMFNKKAAIGKFNETGIWPSACYWSSSLDKNGRASGIDFDMGIMLFSDLRPSHSLSVRCVRG